MNVKQPLLCVATLLGGGGPTGVETHFNQVLSQATAAGYPTKLVTPYTGSKVRRALFRVLKNQSGETSRLLYQRAQGWLVHSELRTLLRTRGNETATLYAQCPTSAKAAIAVSSLNPLWKTVLVIHYNISESSQLEQKGDAKPGGAWSSYLDRLEGDILPRVDKLIFVSDFMRKIVNARLPTLARVPQETIFNFPPEPRRANTRSIKGDLIAIGTLEPRKNQEYLLRVLHEARARGFNFNLAIVGNGPDQAKLEQLSAKLGLSTQVSFLGFRADAAALIPSYRCVVHAALLENCPITLIEGLSYGRPVLAAPVGGIPELFSDGIEGIYWDLKNPARAAHDLIQLLGKPERYQQISAAAKERYDKVFAPLPRRWVAELTGRPPAVMPTVLKS